MKIIGLFIVNLIISGLAQAYPYQDPCQPIETRVEDLLSRMTLDEKVGQMTQVLSNISPSDITTYYIGSILSGGSDGPGGNNTAEEWADLYDNLQSKALATRLGIPIIYGIDAVHGNNKVRDAVVFPHNIGLGAANDPNLMERMGAVTAKEVAATGVDWTFAPCLAVARNERWGRTYESFSEDPQIHENITSSYIEGFQGTDINHMGGEKIVACAKHYIGDGGTTNGINAGNTECNEAVLRTIHLPPYESAIDAGVGTFMTSFSSWNGTRCVFYTWLVTNLLKNELGFDGFVVSDWEDIGSSSTNIKNAINAGIDMSMAPYTWNSFIINLKPLVPSQVPQTRIDDAVRRILRIKFRAGLFEHPYADRSLLPYVGSPEHREVAREAVRKSLVLLKNKKRVLPIAKNADVLVAGTSANSLIKQCGGWTIGWQGMPNENDTSGTTIYGAIQNTCTGSVGYNVFGYGAAAYDAAIVVVGEGPYAEGSGDDSDLSLSSAEITIINNVKNSGTPYVIVLVSGRPMIITNQLADANAFVAAWLPGTEGQGIADVLFGDYGFTGKLSFSWPRDMTQVPINIGDLNYDPLFAFGYGLVTLPDYDGDYDVDVVDLEVICSSWLKTQGQPGFDWRADLYGDGDNIIDFSDYAIFAEKWNP